MKYTMEFELPDNDTILSEKIIMVDWAYAGYSGICRAKPDKKRVEFIESYIKHGDGDYEWADNHGELIRCRDCKYYNSKPDSHGDRCDKIHWSRNDDWFCADGIKRGETK